MAVPSPSDLSTPFATAYFEAAQAGADMRAVANVLETLRGQLAQATDPYEVWAAFDDQVGIADLDRLMPALAKLSGAFQAAVISSDVARLRKAFDEDREKGWVQWLDAYARAFDPRGWRGFYGATIAQQALSYSPHPDWPVDRIQKAVRAVYEERWPEAYDWLLFLAQGELPGEFRARFFTMVAEIQIFHFVQLTKARTYLEKSSDLVPDLLLTRNAWGEYWTAMEKWDKGREIFSEIVKAAPKRPEGYVGMGDCDAKTGQLASAETWYYQAVVNAPGSSTVYSSLVSLWLRPDQPKDKADPTKIDSQIRPLVVRWKALLERPATASLNVGISYKNGRQFNQARHYLEEAIHSEPSCALFYVWLGYTALDEAGQASSADAGRLPSSALDNFNTTIRLAPAALDGYWAVSWFYMQQENWPEAEQWTRRCLQMHPEWESFVRVRMGEVLRRQGRLAEAEAELTRSLRLEGVNQAALDVLSSLVDDYHAKGEEDGARRALDLWKEKSDPARSYLYFNRLANWSYEAGDYATAANLYRQALEVKEADPVLHSNLAGALQRLRVPGERCKELQEAIAELERSNELEPQEDLPGKISALRAELTFLQSYGEIAAGFDPVVDAVRVFIDGAVVPEILTGDNLAPATTDAVNGVRARLKQQFGFVLPGVNFRDLQPPGSGEYRIVLNEASTYTGSVKAGSVLTTVLNRLEEVVQDHMVEFLGHDAIAGMLNAVASQPALNIVKDVTRLTPFVGVLRHRLARRESIEPLASIAEEFDRTSGGDDVRAAVTPRASGEASTLPDGDFPHLVVKVADTDAGFLTEARNNSVDLQKSFFDQRGLPLPPIDFQPDPSLRDHTAVMLLNGRQVSIIRNPDADAIRRAIQDCETELIVPEVTICFLGRLNDRYPVLIRATKARLDVRTITSFIRERLRTSQSIKNLPGILEDELQASLGAPPASGIANQIQAPSGKTQT